MKVIICGAGQVGYGIAEQLSREDNEVSVIDTSAALIAAITETLDVRGYVGHGAHPDMLAKAGADQADMIIAVTLHDEINIVACEVAHALFNVPTKVARIRDQSYLAPEYGDLFSRENMSIDVTISPEIEVGKMVLRRIAFPGATDVVRFADDNVFMLAIECMEDCPVINTPLQQLSHLSRSRCNCGRRLQGRPSQGRRLGRAAPVWRSCLCHLPAATRTQNARTFWP